MRLCIAARSTSTRRRKQSWTIGQPHIGNSSANRNDRLTVYRLAETLEILADADPDRVEELEDEVAKLENQVEALEAQLEKAQRTPTEVKA
jgi:ubiquinone biosynthesis protein UbiJ